MQSHIVMGVAGCGKSSLGRRLADELGLPLIEGDDFHPAGSKAKMSAGIPLTDADRAGWLDALSAQLAQAADGAVMTCSALKRDYRQRLRAASPGLRFIHLTIGRDAALRRVRSRAGAHLFPPSLVDSQFQTLESPADEPGVLELDAELPIDLLAEQAAAWARQQELTNAIDR